MRYWMGIFAGVVITLGVVAAGSRAKESSADVVEGPALCETYGNAMNKILLERFPEENDPILLARKTGGVPLVGYFYTPEPRQMDWACDGRLLTVTIRGPWTLDTADMESALEVLLRDLRSRSLSPAKDEVEIVLASQPMDESVQLDAAWAERELIESLAPEAGIRGPSLFDTYDCAGGCWPFDNPLVVPEKRHEQ